MNTITFAFALLAVAWLWYDGLRSREGLLQLPFLTGLVVLVFPLPEALVLYLHPERVPEGALWRSFFMVGLGCLATSAGYRLHPSRVARAPAALHPTKMLLGGCLLQAVAWFGFYKIATLFGGVVPYFSVEGGNSVVWEGEIVKYNFLRSFGYPALVLLLAAYRLRPSIPLMGLVALSYAMPVAEVVLRGRRSGALLVLMVTGVHLYFHRGKLLPRFAAIPLAGLGLAAVLIVPRVREHAAIGADHKRLTEFNTSEVVREMQSADGSSVFRNTVFLVAAATVSGDYGCGTYYVDTVIRNFVPRQLVGEEVLNRLFLSGYKDGMDEWTENVTGYRRATSEFYGAFGELFSQFWYFGAFYFFGTAWFFRRLWDASALSQGNSAQVYYSTLLPWVLVGIADSPTDLLLSSIIMVVLIVPFLVWARISVPRKPWSSRDVRLPSDTPEPRVNPADVG